MATSSASKKGSSSSASRAFLSPVTVGVLVVALAVLIQVVTVPSITGPAHPKKAYSSFPQFYPFYQSEHTNDVNRKLHFAGTSIVLAMFLLNFSSLPSILFAACIGYLTCPLFLGVGHGFFEFGIVIGTFILMHKLSTGKTGLAVLIPIIGYSFAWFGHFFIEHNRPATFTYPTYSLMGDFFMFYRIATGQETF